MTLRLRSNHCLNLAFKAIAPASIKFEEHTDVVEPSLEGVQATPVRGVDAICKALLPLPKGAQETLSLEWTYFALHASEASAVPVESLRVVSGQLLRKTFLVDTLQPSHSDFLTYAAIRQAIQAHHSTISKDTSFYPLFRWTATIEDVPSVAALIPTKTTLPTPAPPQSSTAKGPKENAENKGDKPSAEEIAARKAAKEKAKDEKPKTDKPAAAAPPPATPAGPVNPAAVLDIRVGSIIAAKLHPDADGLYVETIDLGEAAPRQIVSGLVKWKITVEDLVGSQVLVVCNLKPSKLRGVESQRMVLCASTETTLEIARPPAGSQPGDKMTFPGFTSTTPPGLFDLKKNPEYLSGLKTDAKGVPVWEVESSPLTLPKGTMTTKIPNGVVR
eukprot:PhF_6_TR21195/c0_g1_i1/m.30577/K15437/AIMP1, ARC1; aminoacyl tRNA synthase complex-interacting multifunctional protein 1